MTDSAHIGQAIGANLAIGVRYTNILGLGDAPTVGAFMYVSVVDIE